MRVFLRPGPLVTRLSAHTPTNWFPRAVALCAVLAVGAFGCQTGAPAEAAAPTPPAQTADASASATLEEQAPAPASAAEPAEDRAGAPAAAAAPQLAQAADECTGTTPSRTTEAPSAGEPVECTTCLGDAAPLWSLTDFQEQSCGFGQTYGLDAFQGRPLMVVLLSAGCGYCLGQAEKLEELWWELRANGHEFNFAVINMAAQAERQSALLERASFPMFQGTPDVDGWALMGGGKDDFYFYDADGFLRAHYPAHGTVDTGLSREEGYGNVRDAMLHLLGEEVALPGDGVGSRPE